MTYPAAPSPAMPANAMPSYLDSILSTVLVGGGAVLVKNGTLSADQLQQGVAAVVTLLGLGWAVINANPSKQSPIAMLLGWVRAAPVRQQQAYTAAMLDAEDVLVARLTPLIHAQIKAHAGLLAGPIDSLADSALRQGAAKAETFLDPAQSPQS